MTHGLQHRLLRPWAFPSKRTGVGCHCLLQRIFPTQGSNSGLLPCRQTLYRLSHQGSIVACNNSPEMGPTASGPLAHTPQPSPHCPTALAVCALRLRSAWNVLLQIFRGLAPPSSSFGAHSLTLSRTEFSSFHQKLCTVLIHCHFYSFAFCLCLPIRIQSFN